ncbi:LysM peptidoglycan-binding domain-containing protein [Candidatus Leptofilum sp.]|uniref:LysM peptidoglycan-binding domain-containing protein n=1 Tax=Candidatus Leptofilum sp. TaxID=3241576 RepID=UPI003B5AE177
MKFRTIRVPVLFFVLVGLLLTASCQEEGPTPAVPLNQPLNPVNNPDDTAVIDQPAVTSEEPAEETVEQQEEPAEEEAEVEQQEEPAVEEPAPTEETSPAENTNVPAVGSTVDHQVQAGDWLMQIARCYGADYAAVRRANPQLANPNFIKPGAVVTVPNIGSHGDVHGSPCVAEYTVAMGDTWLGLAEQFGTTAVILRRVNPGPLLAADKIIVPAYPTESE